jgi:hypothetical protein
MQNLPITVPLFTTIAHGTQVYCEIDPSVRQWVLFEIPSDFVLTEELEYHIIDSLGFWAYDGGIGQMCRSEARIRQQGRRLLVTSDFWRDC